MKIGYDAKRIFHNFRGLGNYSRTLVESMMKYYPENEYFLYTPPIEDKRAMEWKRKYENSKIVTPEGFLGKKFSSAWRSMFLSNVIKDDNLDIYHGLSHEIPPGINKTKTKSVVTIHDLIYLKFPEFFPWVDRQVYDKKFRYSADQADIVIAICEQTKNDIIEHFKTPEEKIKVIYQSCNPQFYTMKKSEELNLVKEKYSLPEKFIFYVGAIEERKNAMSLVKAYIKLKDKYDHGLVLVGDGGQYRKDIERLVLEQGLQDRVKMISYVDGDELPSLYQLADLFVYPSFYEGWGIPIVEALFSETAVITTKGGCFQESGGDYCLYIDPHDESEIVNAIDKVLSDDNLKEKMVRNGRHHAEKFHWKNTSKSLFNLYQELI